MPDRLGRALEQLPTPSSDRRRREIIRTVDATPPRRSRVAIRAAVAACLAVLAAATLTWTPFGQAVADELGGLVGIGDEPSFDQAQNPDLPAVGEALVVQAGTIPGTSQGFEVAGFAARAAEVPDADRSDLSGSYSCLNFDLPTIESPRDVGSGLTCVGEPAGTTIAFDSLSDFENQFGDQSRYLLQGELAADVAGVDVAYRSKSSGDRVVVSAAVAQLKGDLAKAVDAPVEFGRFYAFLPADADLGSSVEFTARDADGIESGSDTFQDPRQQ